MIPWGTIIVFAVGISLGTVLLETDGAAWLSNKAFGALGLETMPIIAVIALITAYNIIIHLGFVSATNLAATLITIFIALKLSMSLPVIDIGFVRILQFVIILG